MPDAPREFVDSNVLVYGDDSSAGPRQAAALQLLDRIWASRTGCLSVQVLQEYFVTITRKVPKPMPDDVAEERIRDLSVWTIFSPAAEDVIAAIALARKHKLSFWDAMILESAAQLGCETVWSEVFRMAFGFVALSSGIPSSHYLTVKITSRITVVLPDVASNLSR